MNIVESQQCLVWRRPIWAESVHLPRNEISAKPASAITQPACTHLLFSPRRSGQLEADNNVAEPTML